MGAERYRDGFKPTLHHDLIDLPKRWKKGRVIFALSARIRENHLIIEDSTWRRFWLHSRGDGQRVDGNFGLAGVSGVSA